MAEGGSGGGFGDVFAAGIVVFRDEVDEARGHFDGLGGRVIFVFGVGRVFGGFLGGGGFLIIGGINGSFGRGGDDGGGTGVCPGGGSLIPASGVLAAAAWHCGRWLQFGDPESSKPWRRKNAMTAVSNKVW